jgi:hypothetical protein
MSARSVRLFLACAAVALGAHAAGALGACSRHADIRDEPDVGTIDPNPDLDAGDIPDLDSGLASDAYPTCADRPQGDCYGSVDFPCDFVSWMNQTAASCQLATGCKTNGWLEVTMGADGCVAAIGMDQPNDEMVACLLAEFGSVQCPCGEIQGTYFFGLDNMGGVCQDGGPPA